MATYECTVSIGAGVLSGAPYCGFRAPTRTMKIKEIRIVATNTTASSVGLAVPTNIATPPVANASTTPNARDPRDAACTGQVDTGWSVAPTAPALPPPYNRSEVVAGVVGNGLSWVFQDPEVVPIGKQIALFNSGAATAGAVNITVVFDE